MKSSQLRIIAFMAAVSLAAALSGCGNEKNPPSSPSSALSASVSSASSETEGEPGAKEINLTGLPLVKEKQTITVATVVVDGQPANSEIRFWQELEEATNVHVEWSDTLLSAWSDKKNVMFAADDQPDIYQGAGLLTNDDVLSLGAGGKIIAIQDYIDTYMPNTAAYYEQFPDWETAITAPDGNIYSCPNIMEVGGGTFSYGYPPFVNQNWAQKVSLSFKFDPNVPMTLDQFTELLTAFKTQDPNGNGLADEIPWSPMNVSSLYAFGASFGFIGNTVFVKDDQVLWSVQQPEFKEFVHWLNGLWEAGLLDTETFTQNGNMYTAKIKDPEDVVGYTTNWRSGSLQISADDDRFVLSVPLSVEGHTPAWPKEADFSLERGGSVVTASAENPELCLRWIDNLVAPDNSLQLNSAQLIGEHLEKEADGTYKQLRALDWNRDGERSLMPGNNSKHYVVTAELWNKQQVLPPVSIQKDPIDQQFAAYEPQGMSKYPATVWMNTEDAKQVNIVLSEVQPYIDSMFAVWVTEGGIDEGWDDFQNTLVSMKANEALEIYQQYYDQLK